MELGGNNRRSSEMQGPRPTPLKIQKKKMMKKPRMNNDPPLQSQPRQPIIIYTVSPKIIHTTPSDFMNLVQRLTGSNSSSSSSNSSLITNNNNDDGNMASPAAIEKAKQHPNGEELLDIMGTTSMFHGILSPAPTSLSPVPAGFFSASDPTGVNLFHDLRIFMEPAFMPINNPTPSSSINYLLSLSPHTPLSIDFFTHVFH